MGGRGREPVRGQSAQRPPYYSLGRGETVGVVRRERPPTVEPRMQRRVQP